MTPYNRVLLRVGGAAIIASLMIALIFVQTDVVAAQLKRDETAALGLQAMGDQLLSAVHDQRESLDEYLLSADPRPLARYWQAVADEMNIAQQISARAGDLTGVDDALAAVDAENDIWRVSVAGPAIAAVQSGSAEALRASVLRRSRAWEGLRPPPTGSLSISMPSRLSSVRGPMPSVPSGSPRRASALALSCLRQGCHCGS